MVKGCHNCKKKRSAEVCAACKVVDYDDLRISMTAHLQPEAAANVPAVERERARLRLAGISPDAADRLGALFASLAALDPVDALLLLHMANGGTLSGFGAALRDTSRNALAKYGPGMSRATAFARWEKLCAAFAPFRALAANARRFHSPTAGRSWYEETAEARGDASTRMLGGKA